MSASDRSDFRPQAPDLDHGPAKNSEPGPPECSSDGDPTLLALVRLMRIRQRLLDDLQPILRPYGLSESTYNALRILRGAQEGRLRCQDVGDRLMTRVPDVTRLADRLERSGLVERVRCPEDRRVCYVRIKPEGLELLKELDEPVDGLRRTCFARLTGRDMKTLNRLLGKVLGE